MSGGDYVVCDDDALLLSDLKNEHNGYDHLHSLQMSPGSGSGSDPRKEQREEELILTILLMLHPPRE